MEIEVKYRKVEDLIPYVNNSRKHSDEQVAQIASSIKEFGWTNPILIDGTNSIIAGHGRLMAARKLKMEEVPTIELSHLTDTQRKALVIADNKLALNADWDTTLLTIELDELLKDGFALIKTIMSDVNFDAGSEEDQGKLDQLDPKWICCPHCGKEFDAREA